MNGLTWLQLSESDDFLTRNLVDNLFFWIETRKIQKGYQTQLKIDRQIILKLLKRYIIDAEKPNLEKCLNHFMNQPSTRTYLSRYRGDEQTIQEFKKHTRKYFEMYFPECGFELMTTDRYEVKSGVLETSVVAKKEYNAGDEVKYLTGTFAELKPEEEDFLDKSDFSVMNLTSRVNPCLMLGPSRFVNHDCDANARFASSRNGLKIFATKNILVGQEITVTYAKSYFGKDNKDCLCATCERLQKGYYDPNKYVIPDDAELIDISSSEESSEKEDDIEIIVVDTDSETEEKNTNEGTPADGEALSTVSPVPIDPQEFAKTTSNKDGKKLPSIVSCISLATDEPFVEPDSEEFGGRRLRPRQQIMMSGKHVTRNDILKLYPRDQSVDSLLIQIPNLNREVLRQRQINRTLHKLLMTQLYKTDDKVHIYDCRHCGIYFKLLPDSPHQYQEYCQRCARHQLVYGLAWPETKKKAHSGYLVLDEGNERPPLANVEHLTPRELRPKRKKARHGGIATAQGSAYPPTTSGRRVIHRRNKLRTPAQHSDSFSESSSESSDGDSETPEVLPLGSAHAGKGGIKRVATMKTMRVREEFNESADDGEVRKKDRILHMEDRKELSELKVRNVLPISRATMISKMPGVKKELPNEPNDNDNHHRHHHHHQHHHHHMNGRHTNGRTNGNSHHGIHRVQDIRRNRFEKNKPEDRSRDSTPTKEEMLASHPKINPSELAKFANDRRASVNGLINIQRQAQKARDKSSGIERISEQKFIGTKADKNHDEEREDNKRPTIPSDVEIVEITSELDDDITPVKPFKPRNEGRKRPEETSSSKEASSPVKKAKYGGGGLHKVSLPSGVKPETIARPKLKLNGFASKATKKEQTNQTVFLEISDSGSSHEVMGSDFRPQFYTKA